MGYFVSLKNGTFRFSQSRPGSVPRAQNPLPFHFPDASPVEYSSQSRFHNKLKVIIKLHSQIMQSDPNRYNVFTCYCMGRLYEGPQHPLNPKIVARFWRLILSGYKRQTDGDMLSTWYYVSSFLIIGIVIWGHCNRSIHPIILILRSQLYRWRKSSSLWRYIRCPIPSCNCILKNGVRATKCWESNSLIIRLLKGFVWWQTICNLYWRENYSKLLVENSISISYP